MIRIREATQKDCKDILALVKELAIFEKAPDEVVLTLSEFEEAGFGAKPVYWAFVACTEKDEIIGFALYYIRFSTWKGERMYLEDLYVTEAYRGKGVGTMLFDTLIQVAREKKFTGLVWQVLDWNEGAIQFYKKYNAHLDPQWVNGSLTIC